MRRALPLIIALVVVIGMGLTGIGSPEGSEPTTVGGNDPVQSAKNVVTMDRQEIPSSKPENPPSNQELTLREQLEQLPGWQPYVYESLGRRDPFSPLLSDGEDEKRLSDLPDPRNLVLVGVLWGEDDKFALVENTRGQNFVLREGDPVWRGRIVTVEPKSITIRYNHFGMWETINLPLSVGKEAIHAVER